MNTKLTYLLWILLIGPLLVYGQKKARMDHILRMSELAYQKEMAAQNQNGSARAVSAKNALKATYRKSLKKESDEEIILAIAEFKGAIQDIENLGVKVGSQIGNFLTLEIPIEKITALSELDGMIAMEAAREVHYKLDDARSQVRADEANDLLGYDGEGVIVGLVDTGIDIAHPSFQNANGTTRILSIWDQEGTGSAPASFNYGIEWTSSQINTGTCTHTDTKGHGTGMAGIAAGNGREDGGTTPYIGVAPKADIIMVAGKRTYNNFSTDISTLTSTVIDGVSYISQKAQSLGKPWVVNLSLGLDAGPRNGTSLFERAISEFVNSGAGEGRVIVTSAGNRGYDNSNVNSQATNRIHMDGSGAKTLEFTINGSAVRSALMEIYYPSSSSYSFTLTSPNGVQYGPVSPGNWLNSFDDPAEGAIVIDNYSFGLDPFYDGTDGICYISFHDYQGTTPAIPLATGQWTLQVSSGSGTWDAYLINGNGNTTANFELNSYTNRRIISEPGNAANVITVGSINSKNTWDNIGNTISGFPIGEISYFSSPGPSRSGLTKPEIYAPGAWVATALSIDRNPQPQLDFYSDESFEYFYTTGTSLSSAFVAGAAALLLEQGDAGNQYTPNEVKEILLENATPSGVLDVFEALAGDPLGIEDEVIIDNKYQNDEILDLGVFYTFEAYFSDQSPFGDSGASYEWKLELEHSGGSYQISQFTDGAGNESDWTFRVLQSNVPAGYSWTRSPEGHIEGKITVTCLDTDGFYHSDQDNIKLKFKPNKPVIYSALRDDPTEVTLNYISGGAATYRIYYDTNSGTPYSGTGLNEGSSPINVGTNVSTTLTGLDPNNDYYFAVMGVNAQGTSEYSNEFVISDDDNSPPSSANYQVDWKDLVGTSFSNGRLTKTSTTSWWNAGAASQNILPPYENGWVEYTVEANSGKYRMFGLSAVNPNASWNTIEYNLYLYNGTFDIYQNGTFKSSEGSYSAGDDVRVERSGSNILFKKNGSTLYSIPTDASKGLMVDVSMYNPSSYFTDMQASFDDVYRVTWTDLSNTYVSGNDLVKDSSAASWWNGGAASVEIIPGNTNGWIQTVADETTTYKMIGLSSQNANNSWNTIEYNFYLKKGTIEIYESGSYKCGCGSYTAGDKIKVEKYGSQVLYKKNGTTIYSSSVDPSEDLLADISIYTPGAALKEVVIKTEDTTVPITQSFDYVIAYESDEFFNTTDSTLISDNSTVYAPENVVFGNEYQLSDSLGMNSELFKVFPVPSRKFLSLESKQFDFSVDNGYKLTIADTQTGMVVNPRLYKMEIKGKIMQIDISNMKEGIYSLKLSDRGGMLIQTRFIKHN